MAHSPLYTKHYYYCGNVIRLDFEILIQSQRHSGRVWTGILKVVAIMSGLKKSPSGSSVKSTGSTNSNVSAAANGVKPEPRKKLEFLANLKKYFTRVTPAPTNRVGCQLWPVVTVLKYGGTLPLFVSEKGDQIVAPSFSSVQALPSLALAGLFLYWWASVIFVDDRPVPEEP